jgi:hypothetical protein
MRRLAASLFFLPILSFTAPVDAQFVGRHDYGAAGLSNPFIGDSRQPGPGLCRELRDIRHQIRQERNNGALSHREARQLRRQASAIEQLAERYGADGLSPSEQDELETRTHYLSDAINRPP